MKKAFSTLFVFFFALQIFAQNSENEKRYLSDHYVKRMEVFQADKTKRYDVVFLGNSITERADWQDLIGNGILIANRGIGGDNTFGVLARLREVLDLSPSKVFLMIGINDMARSTPVDTIFSNIQRIVKEIKMTNSAIQVYVQSTLPVNPSMTTYAVSRKADIIELNSKLKDGFLAYKDVFFVNTQMLLVDENGDLGAQYTNDGVHLTSKAYEKMVQYYIEQGLLTD